MGDIADYYTMQNLFAEWQYNDNNIYKDEDFDIWTTKDGTRIAVTDMTNSHLINTINMLKRNDPKNVWIKPLQLELEIRNNECDASEFDLY